MAKRKQVRWIGNKNKKEFHRVVKGDRHPPKCNLDDVKPEHRVVFPTARAAREANYDAAAHCTRKFKSRDNK